MRDFIERFVILFKFRVAIVLNYFCLTQTGVPADIVENALTAKCEMEI